MPGDIQELSSTSTQLLVDVRGQIPRPGYYPYQSNSDALWYLQQSADINDLHRLPNLLIIRHAPKNGQSLSFNLAETTRPVLVQPGDILIFHFIELPLQLDVKMPPVIITGPEQSTPAAPETTLYFQELEENTVTPSFIQVFNQILHSQATHQFHSMTVINDSLAEDSSRFIHCVAVAYARWLHSRILIIQTSHALQGRNALTPDRSRLTNFNINTQRLSYPNGLIDIIPPSALGYRHGQPNVFMLSALLHQWQQQYDLILVDTNALSSETSPIDSVLAAAQTEASFVLVSSNSLQVSFVRQLRRFQLQHQLALRGIISLEGKRS